MFRTKYTGPTDTTGSRITATGMVNGRQHQKTIPYPYALSGVDVHLAALVALVEANSDGFTRSMIDGIEQIVATETATGYTFDFRWPWRTQG